jgi:hypothetical protein
VSSRDEITRRLVAANPVALDTVAVIDPRSAADRDATWRRIQSAPHAPRPAGRRRRARRSLVVALAVLLALGASIAGALVVSHRLQDDPTLPAWAGLDSTGAAYLGEQEGIAYYRAAGTNPGETCLVLATAASGFQLASDCVDRVPFDESGGIVLVQPTGDHYLVAGLLPEGVTTALIAGAPVAVEDGFLMASAPKSPGTIVRVYGPGATEEATRLMPGVRSTYRAESAYGPGYGVLTTPTPRIGPGTP